MKKADFDELKSILSTMNGRLEKMGVDLDTVKANQKVYNSKVDAWDEDFKSIRSAVTNVEAVCEETQRQVQQIQSSTIDTSDKLGKRVRRLEIVKNESAKDPPSGGRRPAKKN